MWNINTKPAAGFSTHTLPPLPPLPPAPPSRYCSQEMGQTWRLCEGRTRLYPVWLEQSISETHSDTYVQWWQIIYLVACHIVGIDITELKNITTHTHDCMHIHTHTNTHTHTHSCIHSKCTDAYIHTQTHAYTYEKYRHVCTHTHNTHMTAYMHRHT